MASLKQIVKDYKYDIDTGIAWIAIYKDGRSWNAEVFWSEDGNYDDGYIFSRADYKKMKAIVKKDHKAICINGYYMGFGEDFTLKEIENKIQYFYTCRLNQLDGDFLSCFVIEPKKPEHGSFEELQDILDTIKDKVIVTGSYAYGKETMFSDIDMYIKEKPEDEVDCESGEDTYCRELIRYFESLGYEWDSVFPDSFSVDDAYTPLEFSAYYDIEDETFELEVCGVTMQAAKSTYTSDKYLNGQKRNRL